MLESGNSIADRGGQMVVLSEPVVDCPVYCDYHFLDSCLERSCEDEGVFVRVNIVKVLHASFGWMCNRYEHTSSQKKRNIL